jgi:hypothetical protein
MQKNDLIICTFEESEILVVEILLKRQAYIHL